MADVNLISRRRLLTAMALSPLLWRMQMAQAAPMKNERIVALEWLPVELMLALGVTPYGVADIPNYRMWVNEPVLPDSVIDVGLRWRWPTCWVNRRLHIAIWRSLMPLSMD